MTKMDLDKDMTEKVCDIVMRERSLSLSDREWKFRLRGYGYGIEQREDGEVITSLLKGCEICPLPQQDAPAEEPRYAA